VKSNGPALEEQFDDEAASYVSDLYGDTMSEKVAVSLQVCAKEIGAHQSSRIGTHQSSRKSAELEAILAYTESARKGGEGTQGSATTGNMKLKGARRHTYPHTHHQKSLISDLI
jgi:hypothetical protein